MNSANASAEAAIDVVSSLRVCAFCPNTCRPSYAASHLQQMESHPPSALSLIALAYLDGLLGKDCGVVETLHRRTALLDSRGHCTYGLDMPSVLTAALEDKI